jgi:predicted anti-sigma-YlaC factor YlaD
MANEKSNGVPMRVSREVILDLLPLYLAGEASAASRALVEEYLLLDESLRQEVDRNAMLEPLQLPAAESRLAEELELRTLKRTRNLLAWQRRLYALAVTFSVLSVGGVGWIQNGHFKFQFFLSAYPQYFWPCISLAVSCWINYFFFRWRVHWTK